MYLVNSGKLGSELCVERFSGDQRISEKLYSLATEGVRGVRYSLYKPIKSALAKLSRRYRFQESERANNSASRPALADTCDRVVIYRSWLRCAFAFGGFFEISSVFGTYARRG